MSDNKIASNWVASEGSSRYDLPHGQWVVFRDEVPYKAQAKLDIECKSLPDEEAMPKRLAFHIVDWSLTYPDGETKLPIVQESLAEFPTQRLVMFLKALEKHNKVIKERYADPLFEDDSTSASPSAV